MNLEEELLACGCDTDADEFRDIVQEIKAVLYPTITDEEMLCNSERYMPGYLQAVRLRVRCAVPDYVINKTLINCRKAGREAEAA